MHLTDAVDALSPDFDYIVIDTPGHDSNLMRQAHAIADTLITPLNDSFVDLDVVGNRRSRNPSLSPAPATMPDGRGGAPQRQNADNVTTDWIVMRNRLSSFGSPQQTSRRRGAARPLTKIEFSFIEGLAERVIFREFYPRGLTALDDLDEATLGSRPTMSHMTACLEIENLLSNIRLDLTTISAESTEQNRNAA